MMSTVLLIHSFYLSRREEEYSLDDVCPSSYGWILVSSKCAGEFEGYKLSGQVPTRFDHWRRGLAYLSL
jgi:hypothetical protein